MTFLNTTLLTGRARFSRTLLFAALGAIATDVHALSLPQRIFRSSTETRPTASVPSEASGYLAVVGPAPLRFAPPPPDPIERPAPAVAPVPVLPTGWVPAPPLPQPASTAPATDAGSPSPASGDSSAAPSATPTVQPVPEKPVSILPDDTRREVRPEDFLPYFETPREEPGPAATFAPPAQATQPPSSATYQLK